MNAPIRSVEDLVEALRGAQIERELSDGTFEDIAGLPAGSVAKYLGPAKSKGLGSISLPLMLGGLGKRLELVDDPDAIERVQGRWKRRNIVGGSAVQMRAKRIEEHVQKTALNIEELMKLALSARMREIGMKGNKSAKRKQRLEKKKARQRSATHAARMRWSKRK